MHEILLDQTHALIDVRYHGTVSIADRLRAIAEAVRLAGDTGFRRFLIDFSDAHSTFDDFARSNAFASRMALDPLLRRSRIAYVAATSRRMNSVVEVLADVRHLPFQRFADRAAALAWLTAPPPAP